MISILITVNSHGDVRAMEIADSDAERESTTWLMSIIEPQLKPIIGLVREAIAARDPKSRVQAA